MPVSKFILFIKVGKGWNGLENRIFAIPKIKLPRGID
jgi:hypothetical protein